jgi:hypothetical protein
MRMRFSIAKYKPETLELIQAAGCGATQSCFDAMNSKLAQSWTSFRVHAMQQAL